MAIELVSWNSAYSNCNTRYRQSMCQETVLRYQIRQRQTFSNSIYLQFMEKQDNSGAVLTPECLEPVNTLITE